MNPARPRILVVEPFPLLRQAVTGLLAADTEVVGAAADAETAWELARRLNPDLVVCDYPLSYPGDGVRLDSRLKTLPRPPLVLVYSGSNDPAVVLDCMGGAADCFVHRSAEPDVLVQAVLALAAGRPLWFVGRPEPAPAGLGTEFDHWSLLTEREREVFDLMLRRWSNEEIAAGLHLARQTVKNYVSAVLQKLEVPSRRELLARAAPRSTDCAA